MARDVYHGKGMSRRDFLKLVGIGSLGAAASTLLPESSYAAVIKDLAVFDFDVTSLEHSVDEKKGSEIADKLAHYLIKNLGDVRVFRLRGYINLGEVPESIGADGCIEGTLALDPGSAAIYAKYGDLSRRDIGNRSYKVSARDSELDKAVLELSNRISTDLNGGRRISEGEGIETLDEFKDFLRKNHPEQYEKQFGGQ
jgi:hypothetical protein